ncbi:prohibitin family protein [Leeia sp. TBRC 13508]|uniref:Prohibitin family protein n=1 Tax=Leeia speluncae TaxID=2884804 RepID=A0ABS8D1J6_9NEIS|nr:prohibitin family protein [Leeia speluncae]MCB6182071.1 prohibitin family protein [Leeia speluncae]
MANAVGAMIGRKLPIIIAAVCIGIVANASFYTINQGERGILLRFGQIQNIESEGLHMKVPFVDTIIPVDVRTLKAESPADAGTRDLQRVSTKVALNYHLNADALRDTYSRVGLDVEGKVIDPRIQESVKAVVARYSAEELLAKRDDVKSDIENQLRAQLRNYNIALEAVQITNFTFSHSFDAAIEAKQTAEQNALKAKNDLQRIEIEAQQKITMAKAEAETIRIQAEAIRAQGGQEYVQLKAIEKWDGVLPQVSGQATPFINLSPKVGAAAASQ